MRTTSGPGDRGRRELLLLGRDRERETLSSLISRLPGNRPGVVTLIGRPGDGQNALLRWAAELATERGIRVLRAAATPAERDLPYGVALQVLATMDAGLERSPRAVLDQERQGRPPGLAELLSSARELPTLVVVADVQWVDAASSRWLHALVRRLAGAPVALLTSRSGTWFEGSDPLLEPGFSPGTAAITELALAPLSGRDAAAAVELICGAEGEDRFTAAAVEISAGNPSVLHDTLRRFVDQGRKPITAHLPELRAIAATVIGDHVTRVLDGLPREAVAVLGAVAVCGDLLDFPLVCRIAGLRTVPEWKVRAMVEATGLTIPSGAGLRLRDPVVTARVLSELSADERADLHSRAAHLAHRAAVNDDDLARILLLAPPIGAGWATHALRRGFAAALHKGEHGQAVSYAARALEEPLDHVERLRLNLELATAEVLAAPEAGDRRLSRIARTADDGAGVRIRATELRLAWGNARGVRQMVAEVLPTAHGGERDDLIALFWLADQALQDDGEQTLPEVPELHEHPPAAAQMGVRAWQLALRGEDLNSSRALARGALSKAHDGGLILPRLAACMALRLADESQEAEARLDALLAETARAHVAVASGRVLATRAELHLRSGRLDAAARDLAAAEHALPPASRHPGVVPYMTAIRIAVDLEMGLFDQARELAAAPAPAAAADSAYWPYLLYAKGLVATVDGDLTKAIELFRECGRWLSQRNRLNPAIMPWRSMAARACRRLGDVEQALRLGQEELSLARRWGAPSALGWAELTVGLMAGEAQPARARMAMHLLRGSPAGMTFLAWALVELAVAEHEAGNEQAAASLLGEALTVTATHPSCRAARLAHAIAERLRTSPAPAPGRQPADWTLLTEVERRAAILAGQGHSNRDIARLLSVTTRTVEQRLSRVYEKLRISTREDLRALSPR
ncbi:AAA family ATPase [Nonomuraea sp. NPDC049480]|uniref:AAA family ATPase n=1 Tax=Nonomuraea sp. NPDC049480 TaxID=3364353 RepID=UPI00379FC02E